MNVRTIIFATLGAILVLVAVLLLTVGGDDDAEPRAAAPPATTERTQPADSLPADALATADTLAPGGDVSPAAERPGQASPSERTDPGDGGARPSGDGGPASGGSTTPTGASTGGPAASGGDARAESQETVESLLRATARRYEGVRALQAEFEQQLTNVLLGRTTRSTGMLYQRQPDRFLMRFTEPAGDIIVSDGTYFWLYYPSSDPRQVIRSERGAGGLDLQSQFVGDPVRRFEATSQGTETVRGRRTHVITLTPREPVGYRRLKVWIDAEDHLVRRFELTEDNGNVRRFELTDLRINPSLPDDLFQFEPPAGAVVVTR